MNDGHFGYGTTLTTKKVPSLRQSVFITRHAARQNIKTVRPSDGIEERWFPTQVFDNGLAQ